MIPHNFEYLVILILVFFSAFFVKQRYNIKLFQSQKQMLYFFGAIYIIGIIWDSYAIFRGHWLYPEGGVLGVFIGNVPLEDFLFIFVVGYFQITLYHLLKKLR